VLALDFITDVAVFPVFVIKCLDLLTALHWWAVLLRRRYQYDMGWAASTGDAYQMGQLTLL
jgi:hypothetical protein